MKANLVLKLFALVFCITACANNNSPAPPAATDKVSTPAAPAPPDTFATGQVIGKVLCRAAPDQSYALYIPRVDQSRALPVIYFFDPHANGALPLEKYKALADACHFILVGSNNSKNGNDWPATARIWDQLFADTRHRLKIDGHRIYTAGFSGGAKVASYIALHHKEIKGVIANSAGLPDGTPPGDFPFSFTAVTGEGDMNMTDLVTINEALDGTRTRHRILFFDGIHEWAPGATMRIAFQGLQLDAMYDKSIPPDEEFIQQYVSESKRRYARDIKTGRLLRAASECQFSIRALDGVGAKAGWFRKESASLTANPRYQEQAQTLQKLLAFEKEKKAEYYRRFQQADMPYWTATIHDLQAKAKAQTPEGAMYQRLVAYLSLAFYSISNHLIADRQDDLARYFVQLYQMDDPANSESWYFGAILDARNRDAAATEKDLLKAVQCGFTDSARLRQQAEFQGLAGKIDLSRIEAGMKKGG